MGSSELTGSEEVNDVHCQQLHLKLSRRAIYPNTTECNNALLIRQTSGNRLARYRINPLAAMGAFLTAVVGTLTLIASPQPSSSIQRTS